MAEQGRTLELGGTKQRSLLAVLLLHANEIVAADRLIGELWGETPPATAPKSVQTYVMRLRRELGAERLTTRAPGYVLHVGPDELDVTRFERLGRPGGCARRWRSGVARRSPTSPTSRSRRPRSHASRSCASPRSRSASTPTWPAGRHADLVGELEALVVAHPLRERLRGQLMLALYRSGRQAEALEAYRAARRELAEELGLEPGDALRRLEQAILEQDPALELEAPGAAAAGAAADRPVAARIPPRRRHARHAASRWPRRSPAPRRRAS